MNGPRYPNRPPFVPREPRPRQTPALPVTTPEDGQRPSTPEDGQTVTTR